MAKNKNINITSGVNTDLVPMKVVGKAKSKKSGEKSLSVTMIVKNEKEVILRCLESLYEYLDYWVIHDTGSTDGTQDIIRKFFKEKRIPGELHETPWKNFGYNRSLAIQDTQGKADYTLLCDADFILIVKDKDFKKKLSADGYLVKYDGHLDYRQNLMVSCKYKWDYIGVTHEYIHCPAAKNIVATDLIVFKHYADGGSRSDKFERDIRLLKQGIEEEPKNSRYYFYLAQSYKDTAQYDEAISYYRKRVDFGGWGEEVYYSLYQLGMCKKRRGDSFWDFMGDFLRAYWYRPQRLEALHQLVNHCRMNGYPQIGYQLGKLAIHNTYPKDMLFIEKPVHDWLFQSEVALCAYMCGKYKQACQINKEILDKGLINHEGELERIKKNDEFFRKAYSEFLKKGGKKVIKKVPNLPLGTHGINLNQQRSEITPEKLEALRKVQEQLKDAQDVSVVLHINTYRPNFEKLMLAIANQSVKPRQIYIILGCKVELTQELTQILARFKQVLPQMNPIKIEGTSVVYDGRLKFMNTVSSKYMVIYDDNRIPGPLNLEYYLKLASAYPDLVQKGIFGQWAWQLHAPIYENGEIISKWESHPHINASRFLGNDQTTGELMEVDYLCGHWFAPTETFMALAKKHDTQEMHLEHWKEDILFSFESRLDSGIKSYKVCPRNQLAGLDFDLAEVQDQSSAEELENRSELIKQYCLKGYKMVEGGQVVVTDEKKMELSEGLVEADQSFQENNEKHVEDVGLFSVSSGLKKIKIPMEHIVGMTKEGGFDYQNRSKGGSEAGSEILKSVMEPRGDLKKPDGGSGSVVKKIDFSSEGLFAVSDGVKQLMKSKKNQHTDEPKNVSEVRDDLKEGLDDGGLVKKFSSGTGKPCRIAIYVPDFISLGGSELTAKALYDRLKVWCEKGEGKKLGHQVMITNAPMEAVNFRPDVMITQQRAVGIATQLCNKLKIRLWIMLHGPRQFIPSPALEMLVFNSAQLMEYEKGEVPSGVRSMFYHPTINLERFKSIGEVGNGRRKYITFIGSSSYNYLKGCDLFVELARAMPRDKFLYIGPVEKIDYEKGNYQLVGKMPELVGLNGEINGYKPDKLPKNLVVRNNTPDLEKVYQESKVLVIPSIVESFGRVAVEASATGVPVVCSGLPGLREATAGLASYVDKYREVGEFKKAVEEVLNWREEYTTKCEEIVRLYEEGVERSFGELVGCL